VKIKIRGARGKKRICLIMEFRRKGILHKLEPDSADVEFVIIGRKLFSAVERNKIKRRIRAILTSLYKESKIGRRVFVFRLKGNWAEMPWKDFYEMVLRMVQ